MEDREGFFDLQANRDFLYIIPEVALRCLDVEKPPSSVRIEPTVAHSKASMVRFEDPLQPTCDCGLDVVQRGWYCSSTKLFTPLLPISPLSIC